MVMRALNGSGADSPPEPPVPVTLPDVACVIRPMCSWPAPSRKNTRAGFFRDQVICTGLTFPVVTRITEPLPTPATHRSSCPWLAAEKAARGAQEHGVQRVDVFVKGPGSGRETAIRSLAATGLEIAEIQDVTPVPHNGCRPRKRRRV